MKVKITIKPNFEGSNLRFVEEELVNIDEEMDFVSSLSLSKNQGNIESFELELENEKGVITYSGGRILANIETSKINLDNSAKLLKRIENAVEDSGDFRNIRLTIFEKLEKPIDQFAELKIKSGKLATISIISENENVIRIGDKDNVRITAVMSNSKVDKIKEKVDMMVEDYRKVSEDV